MVSRGFLSSGSTSSAFWRRGQRILITNLFQGFQDLIFHQRFLKRLQIFHPKVLSFSSMKDGEVLIRVVPLQTKITPGSPEFSVTESFGRSLSTISLCLLASSVYFLKSWSQKFWIRLRSKLLNPNFCFKLFSFNFLFWKSSFAQSSLSHQSRNQLGDDFSIDKCTGSFTGS